MEKSRCKIIQHRNLGLDALRIISMLMIISMHYLTFGGIRNLYYPIIGINYWIGYFIFTFISVAVNCYVLNSGYFLIYSTKFQWEKLVELLVPVVGYSFGIYMILLLTGYVPSQWIFWARAILPVRFTAYWFVVAYIGMYICHPYMNRLVNGMTQREYNRFLGILFVMFSLYSSYGNDTFHLHGGYSFLWFVFLYFLGGYLHIYNENMKNFFNKKILLTIYGCSSIILFLLVWILYQIKFLRKIYYITLKSLIVEPITWLIIITISIIVLMVSIWLNGKFYRKTMSNYLKFIIAYVLITSFFFEVKRYFNIADLQVDFIFLEYNSPFILIASIAIFLLFTWIKISNHIFIRLIKFFTPLTFGVYLIHMHSCMPNIIWIKWLHADKFYYSHWFVLHYIMCILIVFLVSAFVEKMRIILFKYFRHISKQLYNNVYGHHKI